MTHAVHTKLIIVTAFAMIAYAIPAFSHAATTETTATIQSQYQLLMERFESLKSKNSASTTPKAREERPKSDKGTSTVDRNCMATAVGVREDALTTAWNDFSASITSAINERKTALVGAWNTSETGSRDAIKKAWEAWRSDKKDAHTELRNDRRAAWETFKKTAKESCKVTTPKEEGLEKTTSDSIAI
jgi:hypothetical protein